MMLRYFFLMLLTDILIGEEDLRTRFFETLKRYRNTDHLPDMGQRWQRFLDCVEISKKFYPGRTEYKYYQHTVMNDPEYAAFMPRANLTHITPLNEELFDFTVPHSHKIVKRSNADTIDWTAAGIVTNVKDQLSCGSCWAFQSSAGIEARHAQLTGRLVSFSEQFFLDCQTTFSGCAGGYPTDGFRRVMDDQYFPGYNEWPYTAIYSGSCPEPYNSATDASNAMHGIYVTGWYDIPNIVSKYFEYLQTGPIAMGFYIGPSVVNYQAGALCTCSDCASTATGHAGFIVGYTASYWNVKFSWNTDFGNDGYIWFDRSSSYLYQADFFKFGSQAYAILRQEYEFQRIDSSLNWPKGRKACKALGTGWDLAILPTQTLLDKARSVMTAGGSWTDCHIGLSDLDRDGIYLWVNKIELIFNKFDKQNWPSLKWIYMKKAGTLKNWLATSSTNKKKKSLCGRPTTCKDIISLSDKLDATTLPPYAVGTTVTMQCESGYTLDGNSEMTCLEGATWDGTTPTCTPGGNDGGGDSTSYTLTLVAPSHSIPSTDHTVTCSYTSTDTPTAMLISSYISSAWTAVTTSSISESSGTYHVTATVSVVSVDLVIQCTVTTASQSLTKNTTIETLKIESDPTSQAVAVGGPVTLACGSTKPSSTLAKTMTWLFGSTAVSGTVDWDTSPAQFTYTIASAQYSHSGQYTCQVTYDGVGVVTSSAATVSVRGITTQPVTGILLQGATSTLTCAVFGEGQATVSWNSGAGTLSGSSPSYNSGTTTSTLDVTAAGSYVCKGAFGDAVDVTSNAAVVTLSSITLDNTKTGSGQTTTLTCSLNNLASGTYVPVWTVRGVTTTASVTTSSIVNSVMSSEIVVSTVPSGSNTADTTTSIGCGWTTTGQTSAVVTATVTVVDCYSGSAVALYRGTSNTVSANTCSPWSGTTYSTVTDKGLEASYCRYPDVFGTTPWCYYNSVKTSCDTAMCNGLTSTGDSVTVGQTATVTCALSSVISSVSAVTWSVGGSTVPLGSKYSVESAGTGLNYASSLTITDSTVSAEYSCVFTLVVGSAVSGTVSLLTIDIFPTSTSIQAGSSSTVSCTSFGVPSDTVFIWVDTTGTVTTTAIVDNSLNSTLILTSVTVDTTLTCKYTFGGKDYLAKPVIDIYVLSGDTVVARVGSLSTLTCQLTGSLSEPAAVSWTKDSAPVDTTKSTHTLGTFSGGAQTSTLSVTSSDTVGVELYQCVFNFVGGSIGTRTITLDVIDYTFANAATVTGSDMTLTCSYHSDSNPATDLIIQQMVETTWTVVTTPSPSTSSSTTTVIATLSAVEKQFRCVIVTSTVSFTTSAITTQVLEIITNPTGGAFLTTTSTTLTCVTELPASLTASVVWYQGSTIVKSSEQLVASSGTSTSSLTLSDLNFSNKGAYKCKVTYDGIGFVESTTGDVFVRGVQVSLQDASGPVGGTVTLSCSVKGEKEAGIAWSLNTATLAGVKAYLDYVTTSAQTIVISDSTIGAYTCTGYFGDTLNLTTSATVSKYSILLAPSPLSISSTTAVTMSCTASPPVSGVTTKSGWLKDGGVVDQTLEVKTTTTTTNIASQLIFSYPLSSMAGEYSCVIWYGDYSLVSTGANLIMTGIKQFPRAIQALTNTDAAVKCVGVGSDYSTAVTWRVDGVKVSAGTDIATSISTQLVNNIKTTTSTLTLKKIKKKARVSCEMNWSGVKSLAPYDCYVTTVGIKFSPKSTIVVEGNTAKLYCTATSPPRPSIQWKKGNTVISSKYVKTTRISSLYYTSALTLSDDIAGDYSCLATYNSQDAFAGGVAQTDAVTVKLAGVKSLYGPSKVMTGSSVTFNCRANSYPAPTFRWTKNGIFLSKDNGSQKTAELFESQYILASASATDKGWYGCSVLFVSKGKFLGESVAVKRQLNIVDNCATVLIPGPSDGSLSCLGTSSSYMCIIVCSSGFTVPTNSIYTCTDGVWAHITASNPNGKVENCFKVKDPASRTMTITITYSSSDGINTCQLDTGLYVIKAYPYYLAAAALTSVGNGNCQLVAGVKCGGTSTDFTLTFEYKQMLTLSDATVLTTLFNEVKTYVTGNNIDPIGLLIANNQYEKKRRRRSITLRHTSIYHTIREESVTE